MAVLHRATLEPGKAELLDAWLDSRSWAGDGGTELLAAYRFDDPDGEVGVEAFVVRRGQRLLHVPVTYRGAPLPGAEDALVGRTHHSVLGERWVYAAVADPVAVGCYERALRGEQEQAPIEVWEGDVLVERREPSVHLRVEAAGPRDGALHLVDALGHDARAAAAPVRLVASPVDDALLGDGAGFVVAYLA